ncbi:MAG: protein-tyrosine-phosphatase [Cyclobacteriaceae bacterium]|nr:protein-tyrosine-phosphatase [Cyclobacteriaceae bacterium]
MKKTELYKPLAIYFERAIAAAEHLAPERVTALLPISDFIQKNEGKASLVFICTHNSRRSHFGQIWAQLAAWYFGKDAITTFSGGTEATAFNPRAVAALRRAGFRIEAAAGDNPLYRISGGDELPVITAFSKIYDDAANPSNGFVAIMTCSEADHDCPVVQGARIKIPLHYRDPKEADGTPEESSRYDERCFQIATEMAWIMKRK